MIQRMQSLWLLLASFAALLTFHYPFYSGLRTGTPGNQLVYLNASSNMLVTVFTSVLVLGGLVTIFLYKNRRRQLGASIALLLLALLDLVIYFSMTKQYTGGTFSLTALLALAIPLFLLLAARGIWKDERLVKSLDRLR
ncbi:MAG TPA: DUF4293 family protein [Chitinophagaceae bacterium]|nr:DUF4293 family protein [Chitinophagaceae bacterium]